jgi:hypothetical protein
MVATQEREQTHGNRALAGIAGTTGAAIAATTIHGALQDRNLHNALKDETVKQTLVDNITNLQKNSGRITNSENLSKLTNTVTDELSKTKANISDSIKQLAGNAKK